jgi:hypothetical protein
MANENISEFIMFIETNPHSLRDIVEKEKLCVSKIGKISLKS